MSLTASDPIETLLSKLDGVRKAGAGWSAKCPSHDDRHASLSINKGNDGRALVHCHAGCNVADICGAIGLKASDLFDGSHKNNGKANRVMVKTYDYIDADGALLHQTIRFSPKGFSQRRPDGNGAWVWSLKGINPILYRLPELLTAIEDDSDVLVVIAEGEKDVDALREAGFVATCNPMGALKWRDEYGETLRGRNCCIIADRDETGREHAEQVAASLQKHGAQSVKVIEVVAGKDPAEYFSNGGTAPDLKRLIDVAPPWTPTPSANAPVSLGALWLSDPTLREPVIDGLGRRGQVGNVIATSKSYKTFLILGLAICMNQRRHWLERFPTCGGRVLIIDLELQKPDIVKRTRDIAQAMHAPSNEIADGIDVLSLRGRNATIDEIEKLLLGYEPRAYSLIIIDPLYKTYPADFDENSNAQMTMLYRRFERLAEHLDALLFIVHHGTKGSQSEKRVVDVGSGASAQSRSADCHIALREHEDENCVVFDSRVRSFAPVDPLVLRWEYPLWHRDISGDPTALKGGKRGRNRDTAEPQPKDEPAPWTAARFVAEFLTDAPADKLLIGAKARQAGVKLRQIDELLALAQAEKLAFRWTLEKDRAAYYATIEQPITYSRKRGSK